MVLTARRALRKMRGGAQAHLVEADDSHFYVVKFLNNPQHRRILVNELTAAVLLRYLQIATPETAIIHITQDFLETNPDVHVQLGSRREPVRAGRHFASRFPGDPLTTAVYDFVPDAMLQSVVNHDHFRGVLVFDKWAANADARQAIFFRARLKDWASCGGFGRQRLGFVALMMDHGYIFDGPHWDFSDSPIQGLYFRPAVYESVRSLDDFRPWLERVVHLPPDVLDEAARLTPREWLDGDQDAFDALLERLWRRRTKVPDLLRDCAHSRVHPFPNWR